MAQARTFLNPAQRTAAHASSGPAAQPASAPASRPAAPGAHHQLDAVPVQRVVQLGKGKIRKGKVGHAEREMARQGRAGAGQVFGNREGLLPQAPKGHHYEEIQPAGAVIGAAGAGEHRVVILKDHTGRSVKQYATYTHYGDGDSARKGKADFTEF